MQPHTATVAPGNPATPATPASEVDFTDWHFGSRKKPRRRRNPDDAPGSLGSSGASDEPPEATCDHCSEDKPEDDLSSVRVRDGKEELWCKECVYSDTVKCANCDEATADDALLDVKTDEGGRRGRPYITVSWCPLCVDEDAVTCARCEEPCRSGDTSNVRLCGAMARRLGDDAVEYCPDCTQSATFSCASCGEYYSDACDRCTVDDDYTWCSSCAEDAYYCESCDGNYSAQHDHDEGISDYHTGKESGFVPVRSPWISRQAPPAVYFGVELEVECPRDSSRGDFANQVRGSLSDEFLASIENDGSLDHGFEIVTNPAGLDVHRQQWATANLEGLKSHNTTTCGLHVHMTRAALSKLTLGRMAQFLSDERNRIFIETFCRRSFNRYAQQVAEMTITKAHKDRSTRYEVLNLTGSKTVEFRLPKGTTRQTTIIATVEFCYALIRFCRDTSSRTLDANHFKEFVCHVDMLEDTRFLRAYLVDRGLATAKEACLGNKPRTAVPAPQPDLAPAEAPAALPESFEPAENPGYAPRASRTRRATMEHSNMALLDYLQTGEWTVQK